MKNLAFLLLSVAIFSCNPSKSLVSKNENQLVFYKLKKNVYTHISFLQTQTWGKVACNGLIYIHKNQAYIFDTPTDNETSEVLIKTLEDQKIKIKGIVINHFHNDCLGGLEAFHQKKIPSYASEKTIELAKKDSVYIPQIGFSEKLRLKLGKKEIINQFVGEAHTKDNIISYIPSKKTMFGGCMVKELTAGKGNLADANEKEWANTIKKIKVLFPAVDIIVPGHGKPGGLELLDYTASLFEIK